MYAVIESGGKQYRVELGAEIQVDRLDASPGDAITLDRVLLVADGDATAVGQPLVDGATVSAEVLRQERGEKIVVFKYKPKARTRVKQGHRAELTTLRIADIAFGGKSAAKDARQAGAKKDKAQREAEQQAEQQAAADRELAAKLAAAAPAEETSASTPKRASKAKGTVPTAEQAESTGTEKAKPATGAEEAEGEHATAAGSPSADAEQPAVETDSEVAPTDDAPAAAPRKDE
jgi:large subunit ribosomal protein L21